MDEVPGLSSMPSTPWITSPAGNERAFSAMASTRRKFCFVIFSVRRRSVQFVTSASQLSGQRLGPAGVVDHQWALEQVGRHDALPRYSVIDWLGIFNKTQMGRARFHPRSSNLNESSSNESSST